MVNFIPNTTGVEVLALIKSTAILPKFQVEVFNPAKYFIS